MGLFIRGPRPPGAAAEPLVLGPGLIVTSALDLDGCLRALGWTLLSFRVPEYAHLPTFTTASWAWGGDPGQAPETVIICADRPGDHVLVALWPASGGSRIGVVPLSGEGQQAAELESSMLAPWRQHDASLSRRAGDLGAGLIRLVPPILPAGYAEEIVSAAGYRRTRRNTQMVMRTAASMFLGRAPLFIEHRQPRAARRFVRRHLLRQPMSEAALQEIIDGLARSNRMLLPYLQWLPVRTRALMLELSQDRGSFWADLDRLPLIAVSARTLAPRGRPRQGRVGGADGARRA